MNTHTSRSFLHSCLKVPIDPCNNCPAPIYNRPKMYLGRLATTPLSAANRSLKTSEFENVDTMAGNSGIRSLAKLYDSIPDYCDINHLPNEEFYSTLDTLRSTCCELRTKTAQACVVESSSTTSSVSSHFINIQRGKSSKQPKSRPSTGKSSSKKKAGKIKSQGYSNLHCSSETPISNAHKLDFTKHSVIKNYSKEFEDEVKEFQKTLKDFEDELKQRHSFAAYTESKIRTTKVNPNIKEGSDLEKSTDKLPNKPSASNIREFYKKPEDNMRPNSKASNTSLRKFLRKSFSFNDINSIADSRVSEDTEIKHPVDKVSETQILINRTPSKFSSYFAQKTSITSPESIPPKIVIDPPSSETTSVKSSSRSNGGRKKKRQQRDFKVPFSIFNLGTKTESLKNSTPSPVHPVARPNLAATLRVEVSKKKLKELQNNCTYHDSTPQFDWEVRKTPAWKSLSLNESHKEILSMRLATRKAEQEMQKREYELNMELMRQRVKSAPLLLEGATFWGPHIGKLTHTCQREGASHCCQTNQRKARSKSADSRRKVYTRERVESECSQRSNKLNILQKIYGGSSKVHSRSATQTPVRRKSLQSDGKQHAEQTQAPQTQNDSGDELSSLDRAFL
ncbi:uncharacterized protein LOC118745731 [Rhagoletis pomonella]|uniref:uncharacterized protein LOC118745731 n=1 Tax=Rhagoletis pomonella TaxID=28610 RepID=UPI00177FCAE2|nr:uncharacterized protein LOC118745731 [Rhagoletis pomonella]